MKQLIWRLLNAGIQRLGGADGVWSVRRQGLHWRLRTGHFLDRSLIIHGKFETRTTNRLRGVVWPGLRLLDVGANFGYFSVLVTHLAGPTGRSWAFEPTKEFRRRLQEHLRLNDLESRVRVLDYGLSNEPGRLQISIGDSSATLHPVVGGLQESQEWIELKPLDSVCAELGIEGVDLVKVDIDGHEPAFLAGARDFLLREKPVILMEFSQINLDCAGSDIRELKQQLEELGYELYSDLNGRRYDSRTEFLVECGNYTHSANVWAAHRERPDLAMAFKLGVQAESGQHGIPDE
jgi:FkbM family methyltransferase